MTVIELSRPRGLPAYGRPHRGRELAGRDRDLALIAALVDQLPAGDGILLLTGEPGVGKSALLDAAEDRAVAAGIRVLRAAGAESEDVSFFGLNQLLLPLRGELDQLDQPQREVLNVALGFRDGPAPGRLVVSNAALALLLQAAARRPLLLIADDLQWVDQASAQVLGFVARRLRGSRLGLIAAQRSGSACLPVLDRPAHEVRTLDDEAATWLVTARFPGLAPAVRRRIVTEARGNPLALLELGDTGDPGLLAAAATRPRAAEDLDPSRTAFSHPLTRSAVLELAPGSAVRRAGRLAAAAYQAASVTGDLSAAETLLADARRASLGPGALAGTTLASAFVLLHGDGDVTAAHRLLLGELDGAQPDGAQPDGAEPGGTGPSDAGEALEVLLTVCRASGRAEHWESLERLVSRPSSGASASLRAAASSALGPAAPSWPGREAGTLTGQAEPAQVVRIASAAAFTDRLPDCRPALRRVAGPGPRPTGGRWP